MLSPEYLLRISEGGEEIAEILHNEIIKQIVDRIALRLSRGDNYVLTARDKYQIEVLQEAGYLREDIEKILSQHTGLMQNEIAEAMEDAGVRALDYDDAVYRAAGLSPVPLTESPYLIRLMQRAYEATVGEWVNFTRTTADACQQSFIKACDKAYNMVSSGASGYSQAFVEAINEIVADGVVVTYPSGNQDTIETATLRCIRTGVSQATAQITDARMDEMDWDIILVSSHLGARVTDRSDFTNHFWWQGKFYSKSGKDTRFPPYDVCGEGNVQGIHGANCRHSHGPGDGEFNPYEHYDSEENQKEYELQQRQRTMERRIRASKRECMGFREAADKALTPEAKAAAEAAYQKKAALLQKRNAAYNQFCEDNDLKKLNERITIAKWDRKQAAKARAAARKPPKTANSPNVSPQKSTAKKYVEVSSKNDIIETRRSAASIQSASSVQKIAPRKVYTKRQLSEMPIEDLRAYTIECATEWYESGRSGISFPPGKDMRQVAEELARGASKSSIQKDAKALQERLLQIDAEKMGNVVTNAVGKSITVVQSPTINGIPNSITQTIAKKGNITRNYYDETGRQSKQISNDDHGENDNIKFGKNGEHAHDYKYSDDGSLQERPKRELTDEERKENADIL